MTCSGSLEIPDEWIHEIARRKTLAEQELIHNLSFDDPSHQSELIKMVSDLLPPDYDVATHFTPRYLPWRQRIALVPDGDLFAAISAGKVTVVTDEIESFTPSGIELKSGTRLSADVVVSVTGFNLSMLGDIAFVVDGAPVDFADSVTYRGMMFTGVPNMLWVFGYFRASWTLRADLACGFTIRLLDHMRELGASKVTPMLRAVDADMALLEWVDPEDFNPGYFVRAKHLMPQRGTKPEWQHNQNYWIERDILPNADLDDGCLVYE